MTEHPIIFTGAMVRAILDGRKTQTRRVIKKACDITGEWAMVAHPARDGNPAFWWIAGDYGNLADVTLRNYQAGMKCPYGQAGDRMWVREAWGVSSFYDGISPRDINRGAKVAYPATGSYKGVKFRPSIHMPRWASRITLVVDEIRVQRVQEIDIDDAVDEGIERCETCGGNGYLPDDLSSANGGSWFGMCPGCHSESASEQYRELWDSINAKRGYGWDVNPWVWAITFHREEGA